MLKKQDKNKARKKRHLRVRNHISGTAQRPRLNVFRSIANIYAQVIDDTKGITLVCAGSNEKGFEGYGGNVKAAKAVGEKSIAMIKSKELLPLTGYVHGGCSPIGMKKQFRTTIHLTAENYPTIFFSGGKIGCQIEMTLQDLQQVVPVACADIL